MSSKEGSFFSPNKNIRRDFSKCMCFSVNACTSLKQWDYWEGSHPLKVEIFQHKVVKSKFVITESSIELLCVDLWTVRVLGHVTQSCFVCIYIVSLRRRISYKEICLLQLTQPSSGEQ